MIAYIDNHAAHTVVLGAHLDHLGYNQDKNALDLNGEIRNGADDNASGTAALIELAKFLQKASKKGEGYRNNNYLIIHFSAEELGLIGSKYWLENPTIKTSFNYMVNMDMVGRYDATKKMSLGGLGTSSKWAEIIQKTPTNLLFTIDSAGTGPSDHASFYRKDIPVLFMFTGSHADYHKATDDWDKISYIGQKEILRFVQNIIKTSNGYGKLDFLKTREARAIITITCVDNVQARFGVAEILKELSYRRHYQDEPKYWLDFGNSQDTGQVLLSTIGEIKQHNSEISTKQESHS